MLLVPVMVLLVAALGYALCLGAGWTGHGRELVVAAAISLLAAEAGFVPAMLARGADTAAMAQAGLAGTVIQMMLALVLAGAAGFSGLVRLEMPFALWLLACYLTTLAAVVAGLIPLIRSAPPAGAAAKQRHS